MPPKRKPSSAKTLKDATKVEDVTSENGASGDVPKTKKLKPAKETTVVEEPRPKRGRTTKALLKEVEDEKSEETKPKEEKSKEIKSKGRKLKSTEEKTEQEARPTRARAVKEKKPDEEKPEIKPKKTKTTKAETKPKKGRGATKNETEDDFAEDTGNSVKSTSLQNSTETDYSKIDFSCTRKNANGDVFNLKISSWNVDGLRALVKKNGQLFVEYEDPDILCLQEIKCKEEQIPSEIKDLEKKYSAYWCSSEKDGYAGVGLITKVKPLSVSFGIGTEEHDEDGRCITAEYEKFYLVNVYVPNAGRKLVTLPKRLEWNSAFLAYINSLNQKKPIIICGDMNVSHQEIDLANPKTNKKNAGFTQEERDGMTDFLNRGYVDTYRKFYPEKTGVYTFWTYMMKCRSKNIGWRLDYFIVSERFMNNICDNIVRSQVLGSDHCPITLFLNA